MSAIKIAPPSAFEAATAMAYASTLTRTWVSAFVHDWLHGITETSENWADWRAYRAEHTKVTRMDKVKAEALAHALRLKGGNITEAAKALGVGRNLFYRRGVR